MMVLWAASLNLITGQGPALFRQKEPVHVTHRIVQVHIQVDLQIFQTHCDNIQNLITSYSTKQGSRWIRPTATHLLQHTCQQVEMWPSYWSPYGRDKRQLGLVLGLAGGVLGALGLSNLFGRNNDDVVMEHLHLQGHEIEMLQKHMTWLESTVSGAMDGLVDVTETNRILTLTNAVEGALLETNARVSAMSQALSMLQHQKLSPNLMSVSTFESLFRNLTRLGKRHNLHLPFNQPYSLFEFPTSYTLDASHALRITLYIPLVAQTYTLHQFVPFPLYINASDGLISVLPLPKLDLLAVNDNRGLSDHFHLNYGMLDTCVQIESTYFCPHLFETFPNDDTRCLDALYYGQDDNIHLCPLILDQREYVIVQTGHDTFLLFTESGLAWTSHCRQNGSRLSGIFKPGHAKINMVPGCALATKYWTIPETAMSFLEINAKQYPFTCDKLLPESLRAVHDAKAQIKKLHASVQDLNVKMMQHRMTHDAVIHNPRVHASAFIAISLLVSIFILTLTILYCKSARFRRNAANANE